MITRYRRPFTRGYHHYHQLVSISGWGGRPTRGGVVTVVPLPVGLPGGQPFMGMDPSDPLTHVRRWNPQPGMVARLNFDGAQAQGETAMGGTWRNPPSQMRRAAARPRRRPR
jgi:hypothetical protein